MRKAIFGGTFDPIHIGHLHIAYEALYKLNLDKIVFVPSGNPPHKTDRKVTDAAVRYEMVKLAVEDDKRFEVNTYEIDKNDKSYTYKTIEYFNNLEKDTDWFFICGVDCLMEIETWKNVDKILNNINFVVFSRMGYNFSDIMNQKKYIEKKYCTKIILLDMPIFEISSTDVKNKIKYGQEVYYLLPDKVYMYIKDKSLYN